MTGQRRRWEIIVSRSESAAPLRVSVSLPVVRALAVAGVVVIAGAVTIAVTFAKMAQEAGKTKRLAQEVRRLRSDNEKIVDLAKELDAIREREAQLRELLGLGPPPSTSPLAGNDLAALEPIENASFAGLETDGGRPDLWPVTGQVSRVFTVDGGRTHEGIDIAGRTGTPVRAAGNGVVEFAGVDSVFGNVVRIDHGGGYATLYGHNSRLLVSAGQAVLRGQVVAYVGNTGRSSAPHLHFEVRRDGRPLDPMSVSRADARDGSRTR